MEVSVCLLRAQSAKRLFMGLWVTKLSAWESQSVALSISALALLFVLPSQRRRRR